MNGFKINGGNSPTIYGVAVLLFLVFMALGGSVVNAAVAPDSLLDKVYGTKTTKGANLTADTVVKMTIRGSVQYRDPQLAVFKIGSTTLNYQYLSGSGLTHTYRLYIPSNISGYRTITAYTDHRGSDYKTVSTVSSSALDDVMLYSCNKTTNVSCTNGKTIWDTGQTITWAAEGSFILAGEKDVVGAYDTLSGIYSMWVDGHASMGESDPALFQMHRVYTLVPGAHNSSAWQGKQYQHNYSCVRRPGGDSDDEICWVYRAYFPSEFGGWKQVNSNGFRVWTIDEDKTVALSYYRKNDNMDRAEHWITRDRVLQALGIPMGANGLPNNGAFPADAEFKDLRIYVRGQINSDHNDRVVLRVEFDGQTTGCAPATSTSINSCDSGEQALQSLFQYETCTDSAAVKMFGNTAVSGSCWEWEQTYKKSEPDICGSGCTAQRLDTTPPTGRLTTTSMCGGGALSNPYEMHFNTTDAQAGLKIDNATTYVDAKVTAIFADGQELWYPAKSYGVGEDVRSFTIMRLGAPYINAKPDLSLITPGIERAFEDAYLAEDGNAKSRKPVTLKAYVSDEDDNATTYSISFETRAILDTTKPTGTIGTLSGATLIKDLADLKVNLTDSQSGIAAKDVSFYVSYGGRRYPFNMTLLSEGAVSSDACVARKPTSLSYTLDENNNLGSDGGAISALIAEATARNQAFNIEVEVSDWAMNSTVISKSYKFEPQVTKTTRSVPSSSHAFDRSLDLSMADIKATFMGKPATGTPRYYAFIESGNQGATVNGKRITGITPVSLGNMSMSSTTLSLGLGSDRDQVEGSAKLILIPGTASYKRVEIDVEFWKPEGNMTGTNFEPVKTYEETSYNVTSVDNNECRFTGRTDMAKSTHPMDSSPYCYLEWSSLPNNITAVAANTPTAEGTFARADRNTLAYKIYLYDVNGARYQLSSGTKNINVKDVIEFGNHRVPGIRHVFEDTKLDFAASQWARGQNLGEITYSARLLNSDEMAKVNGKNIANSIVNDVAKVTSPADLKLEFGSTREFVDGTADLLLIPSAYPAQAIHINVDFWTQDAEMTGFNFEPVKLDEDVTYGVTHKDQVSCSLNGVAANSQSSNLAANPVCFVEWTKYPQSLEPDLVSIPTLKGVADNEGEHTVEFLVKAVDEDGSEHIVGRGSEVLHVKDTFVYRDVTVPGLSHPFVTRTGKAPVIIEGEELVFMEHSEDVRYHARLLNEDSVPLTVNGVDVTYGQDSDYGIIPDEGTLPFKISTQEDVKEGRSILLLIPDNYRAKAIKVTVDFWVPEASLVMADDTPVQLYEKVSAYAEQNKEGACKITNERNISLNANPFDGEAICYVSWTQLPTDVYPLSQNFPEIYGFTPDTGKQVIKYEYVMIDENGDEHFMAGGEKEIDITPAKDVMRFDFTNLQETYRIIRTIRSDFKQTEGPLCGVLTIDDAEAQDSSALNRPSCLIEWDELPEGIEQRILTTTPAISGIFDIRHGDAEFKWTMYGYTTSGNKIKIMDGGTIVPLLDPPPPVITIPEDFLIEDDRYWFERTSSLINAFKVNVLSSEIAVNVYRDGELYQDSILYGTEVDNFIDFNSYIFYQEDELPNVWDKHEYRIEASYRAIPDIMTTKSIFVTAVPSKSVRPTLEANKETILSTETLVLTSHMEDVFRPTQTTTEQLGEWDILVQDYLSFNNRIPLTDHKRTSFDPVSFELDLSDREVSSMRVIPEATLVSQEPGYESVVSGSKPLYITILRANPIEAEIQSRRLIGEAPLGVYAQLDIKNREDYKALGDIVWETRAKGETEWNKLEAFAGIPERVLNYYDAGKYELRARLFNKNSGAEFVTDLVEIQAYNIPELTLEGPRNVFIGDTAHMRISVVDGEGQELPEEALTIEWSEDDGETWFIGGKNHDIVREEETSVSLRVRARYADAPELEDAMDTGIDRIRFRTIRPPRASIYGSRVIEMDTEAAWNVVLTPPYSNMEIDIRGRFILPDGTIVDGTEATYEPTRDDLAQERIYMYYEVWAEGFKDQGAYSKQDKMLSIWEYKWPNWAYYVRQSAIQAPSEVSISVRNPAGSTSYIEGLEYEWILPAGVRLIQDRFDHTKVFVADTPGSYTIQTIVRDARGHETLMEKTFDVIEADPWVPNFRISPSDENYHDPLELRLVSNIEGGHPRDRISDYRFYLNGEVFAEGSRYASLDLKEGEYDITLEIETNFGEKESLTQHVTVYPNEKPSCSVEVDKSRFGVRFRALCEDPDGRIASHRWVIDGEEVIVTGSRISVSAREDTHATVKLKGVDNGGLESDWIIWQGSLKASD